MHAARFEKTDTLQIYLDRCNYEFSPISFTCDLWWGSLIATINNRTCSAASSLSHCGDLTTHLKLNSARAHISRHAARIWFLIGAIRSPANHDVSFSFLAAHPVAVTTWNALCHRYGNICKSRIASSTFILDTRVACVRFDIFYRDLLLLPVPCGTKLNLLRA